MRFPLRVVGVLGAALGAFGCEVIDAGPEVGVASRCVVSSSFYIERVVPELLENHDCRNAGEGGCHDTDNGNSIYRLQDTSTSLPPLPTDPVGSWPEAWQANFQATSSQISDCDIAELAPLYSEPAGGDTQRHGGGDVFSPNGPELELIQQWLTSGG